jgi:hypothetical protein
MDRVPVMSRAEHASGVDLRAALARSDSMLAGIGPILGHLLSAPDHSLFSDEIVARVAGMLADLARQVLHTQADATGKKGRDAFADRHGEALAEHFQACGNLLAHCHALAIEWQMTSRLEAELGIDPVLSPAMQRLIADSDPTNSSVAMATLAAQARFVQAQRRMELPLGELPGELLHRLLLAWRSYCGESRSEAVDRAETKLRKSFDESSARIALYERLVSLGNDRSDLLLEDAGAGLFFTALAMRSGQTRELAVLSSHGRQTVRLALGLRAAGLDPRRIDETLLRLHPGAAPLVGLEQIDQDQARGMLLDAAHAFEQRS